MALLESERIIEQAIAQAGVDDFNGRFIGANKNEFSDKNGSGYANGSIEIENSAGLS